MNWSQKKVIHYKRLMNVIFIMFFILTMIGVAIPKPRILDAGMSPDTKEWDYEGKPGELDQKRVNVKFWLRVSRQENLNQYGTFDYSFNVKVIRPDGTVVWNEVYGFDENGYQQTDFILPALFVERSPDRSAPMYGIWKIRLSLVHKDTKEEIDAKEFIFNFQKSKNISQLEPGVVYLSDLQEIASGNIHGGLGKDRPYWQSDLVIGNRTFKKGIVTHPMAENGKKAFVEYALGGKYKYFLATLGSAAHQGNYGKGTMNYYILVDGRVVASGRFPMPPDVIEIKIPVNGANTLRLEVDNGGDGHNSDHAAWGDARLEK